MAHSGCLGYSEEGIVSTLSWVPPQLGHPFARGGKWMGFRTHSLMFLPQLWVPMTPSNGFATNLRHRISWVFFFLLSLPPLLPHLTELSFLVSEVKGSEATSPGPSRQLCLTSWCQGQLPHRGAPFTEWSSPLTFHRTSKGCKN